MSTGQHVLVSDGDAQLMRWRRAVSVEEKGGWAMNTCLQFSELLQASHRSLDASKTSKSNIIASYR